LGGSKTFAGVEVKPELWFAVPFESVTDVNNLPNAAVIPPGDMLFAQARLEARGKAGEFDVIWVSVL